jgi:hypothetical protein
LRTPKPDFLLRPTFFGTRKFSREHNTARTSGKKFQEKNIRVKAFDACLRASTWRQDQRYWRDGRCRGRSSAQRFVLLHWLWRHT